MSVAIPSRVDQAVDFRGETFKSGIGKPKESAFEAAVAVASLALRKGHEVRITAPASTTATGAV